MTEYGFSLREVLPCSLILLCLQGLRLSQSCAPGGPLPPGIAIPGGPGGIPGGGDLMSMMNQYCPYCRYCTFCPPSSGGGAPVAAPMAPMGPIGGMGGGACPCPVAPPCQPQPQICAPPPQPPPCAPCLPQPCQCPGGFYQSYGTGYNQQAAAQYTYGRRKREAEADSVSAKSSKTGPEPLLSSVVLKTMLAAPADASKNISQSAQQQQSLIDNSATASHVASSVTANETTTAMQQTFESTSITPSLPIDSSSGIARSIEVQSELDSNRVDKAKSSEELLSDLDVEDIQITWNEQNIPKM